MSNVQIQGMMLNREHPFWGQFPVVHKKVFQCDPLVTPESILRAAEQVGRLQLKQQKLSFEDGYFLLTSRVPWRSLWQGFCKKNASEFWTLMSNALKVECVTHLCHTNPYNLEGL